MKLLILTKYPMRGPSSRYRFYQFLPALTRAGVSVTVEPFFSDAYLDMLFGGKGPSPLYLATRSLARLTHCLAGKRFDLVWIEGELIPFLPAGMERALHALLPRRRVYEFDDANWLRYAEKPLLRDKFLKIMKGATGAVVGNDFLAAYVKQACDRVLEVPDRKSVV